MLILTSYPFKFPFKLQKKKITSCFNSTKGASLVEVVVLLLLIALIAIPALNLLGNNSSSALCSSASWVGGGEDGDKKNYIWDSETKSCVEDFYGGDDGGRCLPNNPTCFGN